MKQPHSFATPKSFLAIKKTKQLSPEPCLNKSKNQLQERPTVIFSLKSRNISQIGIKASKLMTAYQRKNIKPKTQILKPDTQ